MKTENHVPARQIAKFKDLAWQVMEHHFGTRPRQVKHKAGGLSNFVFGAKHKGEEFYVRISPEPARINTFIKEQWVQAAARKAGVPTAQILETGSSVIPFPYMITESVPGSEGTTHPHRSKILRQLGRHSAAINSIRTKGFGETFDWSINKLSRNNTLKDFLEGEYGYESKLEAIERSGVCDGVRVARVRKLLNELTSLKAKPVLNHGDLRLKNVIADESGKITAIIDWEKATSNIAPQWELSIALHDLGVDEKQDFLAGYGITEKKLNQIAPQIKAFNLLNYVQAIEDALRRKDKEQIARLKMRLNGALDLYSL